MYQSVTLNSHQEQIMNKYVLVCFVVSLTDVLKMVSKKKETSWAYPVASHNC